MAVAIFPAKTSVLLPMLRLATLGGLMLIALALLLPVPRDEVSFLDVGQGDAVFLQRGSAQVLIDGGPGNEVLRLLADELPWFDRTIEVVINTHPDRDHLEGLVHLLNHYEVELVVVPYITHSSQLYGEWLSRLRAARPETTIQFAHEGQRITLPDIALAVLGPRAGDTPRKMNNASVLTHIDFAGLRLLLTGDAEAPVERALVARYGSQLSSHVLKAGHHGSKTSTSQELLAAVDPSAVVISVGADNSYGHPHPTVLERLQRFAMWRTDVHGTVHFVRADGGWVVTCGPRARLRAHAKPCITQTVPTNS